jgi:hypothetical protein
MRVLLFGSLSGALLGIEYVLYTLGGVVHSQPVINVAANPLGILAANGLPSAACPMP